MLELITTDVEIDDCWNHIGVRGNKSCLRLEQHVHCRNCEVYAAAAIRILDRYPLQMPAATDQQNPVEPPRSQEAGTSVLVFRVADEWLGLPVGILVEIDTLLPIHSLPHRRSTAVLGVANVRGELVACLSLARLLDIEAVAPAPERALPRMLVVGTTADGRVVFPVDDVDGVHAVPEARLTPAGKGRFSRAVFQWQSRSVRLLDAGELLQAITRNLA